MRSTYRSNLEDPYIELPDAGAASEAEDEELRDSDLIILAARNEDDVSHLEVGNLAPQQDLFSAPSRLSLLPRP